MGRNRIGRAVFGFIPHHVPNGAVLWFYELVSRRGKLPAYPALAERMRRKEASVQVREADGSVSPEGRAPASFIEDQRCRSDEHYGRSTVARAGCEVIAVYNALLTLCGGEVLSLRELLDIFQNRGMALGGLWGTSPRSPRAFFETAGFDTVYSTEAENFNEIAQGFPCAIVSFFNDGCDIRRGVHTICLTKENDGWMAHNLTEDGQARGPYSPMDAFLDTASDRKPKALCLICIRNRS